MKRDNTDYVGKTFGHLTVVSEAETVNNKRYVNCNCDCGSSIKVRLSSLKDGHTKSCNCLSRGKASQRLKTLHSTACKVPTKPFIHILYAYILALWTEGELVDQIKTTIEIQQNPNEPNVNLALVSVYDLNDNSGNSNFTILIKEDTSKDLCNPSTSLFVQNGIHTNFSQLSDFDEYQNDTDDPVYLKVILLIKDRICPNLE